jgi:hypothetical protein
MLGIDREKFPKETAASVEAINNLARPESLRFAVSLLEKTVPETHGLRVDKDRLGIVLHRIVRGIFYHHTLVRMPKSVPFKFVLVGEAAQRAAPLRDAINGLAASLTTIGDGVFRYTFARSSVEDGFDTMWLLKFYDHHVFYCETATNHD